LLNASSLSIYILIEIHRTLMATLQGMMNLTKFSDNEV